MFYAPLNEVDLLIYSQVNVGYSYGGKTVNSSPDTAEDREAVYAQLAQP